MKEMKSYLDAKIDSNSDEFVSFYDELPLWSAPFGLLLLENIPLKVDSTILDVGFWTGFPLIHLARRFGPNSSIYGIDPWEPAVKRVQAKIESNGVQNIKTFLGSAVQR